MPSQCPRCKKTVFFAERQTAEGADWHGLCLRETLKERRETGPKHMFCVQDHPNLNPDKMTAVASSQCTHCSAQIAVGDKFCAGCGNAQ